MTIFEVVEIVKIATIIISLLALIALTIQQGITGEWFGLSEKVRMPWEKEDRKQAKKADKAAREKKWYE